MRETIHASSNLHVHIPTPGCFCLQIVLLHHTLGYVAEFELHVLSPSHVDVQVKLLVIIFHEVGVDCQYDAVDE